MLACAFTYLHIKNMYNVSFMGTVSLCTGLTRTSPFSLSLFLNKHLMAFIKQRQMGNSITGRTHCASFQEQVGSTCHTG